MRRLAIEPTFFLPTLRPWVRPTVRDDAPLAPGLLHGRDGERLRIVMISNLCPPDYDGGFELSALRNATLLRERGHDVQLLTSVYRDSYDGPREDPPWVHRILRLAQTPNGWARAATFLEGKDERQANSPLRSLGRELPLRLQNLKLAHETLRLAPANERAVAQWLEGREFDVAYLFGLHMIGTSTTLPLTAAGIPLVYHHGDDWLAAHLGGNRVKRMILTALHPVTFARERSVDVSNLVLVSEFLRERFVAAGFPRETTSVIYRGVEFPLGWDVERPRLSPPTFLAASRIAFYKGMPIAIRAAGALHRADPERPWRLWLAGSGEPETMSALRTLIAQEGVEHRVKFVGKLSRGDTVALMHQVTAFVSPSVFGEPLGNTNLEAMASGTPLIGSRTGAMDEIVVDGISGLTYDRGDPEALAACMTRILEEPGLGRRLALGGLSRIEQRFTMTHVLDQVEATLRRAVQGRRRSRTR